VGTLAVAFPFLTAIL